MQRDFAADQVHQEKDQTRYKRLTLPARTSGSLDEDIHTNKLVHKSPLPTLISSKSPRSGIQEELHVILDEDMCELPTERVTAVASLALGEQRDALREIPQLIVYTAGASVIVVLYMIIPLMVMLGAFLPETWNRFLVAIEILVLGEFAICTILMRTTTKRVAKQAVREKTPVRLGDSQAFRRAHVSSATAGVRAYRSMSMKSRENQVS